MTMHTNLDFVKRSVMAVALFVMYGNAAKAQPVAGITENQLVLPAKKHSIPFYWQGDSVNSKWEQQAAMLIPVKLKNCPRQFFMQFDLGSPYSLFYKTKLVAIQAKYPKTMSLEDGEEKLKNFSFTTGRMPLFAKEIVVKQFDSSTINWADETAVEIIGTIGTDFIDGKVAIIDYPGKQLVISASVPPELKAKLSLSGFIYEQRRVLLPATIRGKRAVLYFDTGSSMYELLTDKKTAASLAAPGSETIQSKTSSWGKYLTANSIATNDSIEINDTKIALHYATYIEGVSSSQVEQMMKMGIGGMTGNKLFLDYKLVLDTRAKKFGLIRSR